MEPSTIALISIEDINVLNPRVRNQIIAEEIRQNIRSIGLKRPITVAPRRDAKGGKRYDLVCGQGRLEAFIAAGETEIPAVIREVSVEDAHIMSLVENIARRNGNALELLQSIKYLKDRGYEDDAIAAKTNLGKDYIRGIIRLLQQGEEYLVNAVEKGVSPYTRRSTLLRRTMPPCKRPWLKHTNPERCPGKSSSHCGGSSPGAGIMARVSHLPSARAPESPPRI